MGVVHSEELISLKFDLIGHKSTDRDRKILPMATRQSQQSLLSIDNPGRFWPAAARNRDFEKTSDGQTIIYGWSTTADESNGG